ncbi:MAG: hypothetical protein GF308_21235 [Candidatus Heimdallarchaeota archaeon]|nr:hypothetical protein [Candidatus Heimdallarchaeota archaeon]
MMRNHYQIILIFFSVLILIQINPNIPLVENQAKSIQLMYQERNFSESKSIQVFLEIKNDTDFVTHGFPGNGSINNPYIIENLVINETYNYGIKIRETTKHFIIRNCEISANTWGISIYEAAPTTVCIGNNLFNNNSFKSIQILRTTHTIISENTFENSYYGSAIDLLYSNHSQIIHNQLLESNQAGISIRKSPHTNISYNNCENSSISINDESLELYQTYYVEGNLISDLEFGFFLNIKNTIISEPLYGKITLVYCQNVIIENLNFEHNSLSIFNSQQIGIRNCHFSSSDYYGIHIDESGFTNITNCEVQNAAWGINIDYSTNNLIANNSLHHCSNAGIGFFMVENSSIINNSVMNNDIRGIYTSTSQGLFIYGNYLTENGLYGGIEIGSTHYTEISNNTCLCSSANALELRNSDFLTVKYNYLQAAPSKGVHGMYISDCDHAKIFGNDVFGFKLEGLILVWSRQARIFHNHFKDNGDEAIGIGPERCSFHRIYYNIFENNNDGGGSSQASDNAQVNLWYNETTQLGNYWSDWQGEDSYQIGGSQDAEDLYPLTTPPSKTFNPEPIPSIPPQLPVDPPLNHDDAGSGEDAGDSFEKATPIVAGNYTGYITTRDEYDYYKISLESGDEIQITLSSCECADFHLQLYNPGFQLAIYNYTSGIKTVSYNITYSDDWYVVVSDFYSAGQYNFSIDVQKNDTITSTPPITTAPPTTSTPILSSVNVSFIGYCSTVLFLTLNLVLLMRYHRRRKQT